MSKLTVMKAEFVKRPVITSPCETLLKNDLIHDGVIYRGADAVGKLCRDIDEDVRLEIYRGDILCMTIPSTKRRGALSLVENKTTILCWRNHAPFNRTIF